MTSTCKELGGHLPHYGHHISEFAEKLGFHFDMTVTGWRKKHFEMYHNLTQHCIIPKFGSDIEQFQSMDYNMIVQYVKDNYNDIQQDGSDCNWARSWNPGQPNGNDPDGCVGIWRNTPSSNYKFGEISCDVSGLNAGFVCYIRMPYV